MKSLIISLLTTLFTTVTFGQIATKKQLLFDKNKQVYTLDAACGTCMFKMKGTGCTLAVKYSDTCYFVIGTDIDDHGDAHDKAGFCNAIKQAKVQGELKDGKFAVTYFELLKPKSIF
jgi:Family of unknown function (DUF6370)